jgi:hypothetical protein
MVYGLAEQRLDTPELGTKRGLTGVLGFDYAPPDVATVEYFGNAGLLYQGLIPSRGQDALARPVRNIRRFLQRPERSGRDEPPSGDDARDGP